MDNNCGSTTFVIFGASGDLTQRKLVPALYNNFKKGRLNACTNIVGVARRPYTYESFTSLLLEGIKEFSPETFDQATWDNFASLLNYFQADLADAADYPRLDEFLQKLESDPVNRLYYLATAPELYIPVVSHLGAARMAQPETEIEGWRRIIIEKPFGADLASAQELNRAIHAVFDESQVYRIDHYLGKETAQNILFFRFANTIFEPVWNRRYIDNVQISVAETVDVGHRAGYYDKSGVVRDMFQNHLLQLMALIAMEPPSSFRADAIRNEKTKVLESIRPIVLDDTVRGQYSGYSSAEGVTVGSQTATFAAIKLYVDNWRWKGVPFYLRSGKALARKTSEIIIEFQRPPHLMFHLDDEKDFTPNILSLCIQPDEGIHLRFEAKVPDSDQEMRSVNMDFHFYSSFAKTNIPDAYERLLLDALEGDASLFTNSDAIIQAWKLIDPILQGWETVEAPELVVYRPGAWGPRSADELLGREKRRWRLGCTDVDEMVHAK